MSILTYVYVLEHVLTSYKQGWCCFRRKFETSSDIMLESRKNRTEIAVGLRARFGVASLAQQIESRNGDNTCIINRRRSLGGSL